MVRPACELANMEGAIIRRRGHKIWCEGVCGKTGLGVIGARTPTGWRGAAGDISSRAPAVRTRPKSASRWSPLYRPSSPTASLEFAASLPLVASPTHTSQSPATLLSHPFPVCAWSLCLLQPAATNRPSVPATRPLPATPVIHLP